MEKLKQIPILKLVFLCFITTIIISEITFSRYRTTLSNYNTSRVAIMANDISLDLATPADMYPGSAPAVIAITLTNVDDGKICEVAQSYTISIKRGETTNIPFDFELYKDFACTELVNKNELGVFLDDSFIFKAGVREEHTYYLKINWPEEYNDASYAFEIDYFKVIINATQIN